MPKIISIASYLPPKVITNEDLAKRFDSWSAEKILIKTGIAQRHIAEENETAADLAKIAAKRLFEKISIDPKKIDMLLFVTQTPDQALPPSSCGLHKELGLSENCGTFDINQGCAGFIYGLSIAKGLICSGDANHVLLLTGDTYSKLLNSEDRSVVTLFGDGASATLIGPDEPGCPSGIGLCRFGTDGTRGRLLHCGFTGWRLPTEQQEHLKMDGAGILLFTLSTLPRDLKLYLKESGIPLENYTSVIFHQANKFILEKLYAKLEITDKGIISMAQSGNTISSTIPIALDSVYSFEKDKNKRHILLAGFGVGLSWGFTNIII
tara:strand:- start:843 stop:1808 length:966 start_codon:yes stop_codon:yes gene_type:complete